MCIFNGNLNSNAAPFELTGVGRFALSRKEFVPAYVAAFEQGVLQERSEQAIKALRSCRVCPRDCEIDRFNNKIGVCKSGRLARVERLGHDLFRLVQSALRLLPKFRDQPVR